MWHGGCAPLEEESAVVFPSAGLPLLREFSGLLSHSAVHGVIAQLLGGFERGKTKREGAGGKQHLLELSLRWYVSYVLDFVVLIWFFCFVFFNHF